MNAKRPKPDRESTRSATQGPATRPPRRSSTVAARASAAHDERPPVDLDARERRQRGRRKAPGPANPPTPPPPPTPPLARDADDEAAETTIADIPPTEPAAPEER